MIQNLLREKRCIMVCGGGGVGKTTISASLAISAAKIRGRVLVLTIDPARRLLQAFGYSDALLQEGGEPLVLSSEVKTALGLPDSAQLSVAVLNPKWVVDQIVDQTLTSSKAAILRKTILYREMTQMIHGITEYTAYEWVTRMIAKDQYDLIILDTPPAFHAKDFFNAPEKIRNLMESRVFQLFAPKTGSWIKSVMSFGWVEKLLGEGLFKESKLFFETFLSLRDRIVDRCAALSVFFKNQIVGVVVVGTPEATAILEMEGLIKFLEQKQIPLQAMVMNQVEEAVSLEPEEFLAGLSPELLQKLYQLHDHQNAIAERGSQAMARLRQRYPSYPLIEVPMSYAQNGFEILKNNSIKLI